MEGVKQYSRPRHIVSRSILVKIADSVYCVSCMIGVNEDELVKTDTGEKF
jgi:hypothetical protein